MLRQSVRTGRNANRRCTTIAAIDPAATFAARVDAPLSPQAVTGRATRRTGPGASPSHALAPNSLRPYHRPCRRAAYSLHGTLGPHYPQAVPQSRLLPTRHPWAPLAGRGPQGACGARWSSGRRAPGRPSGRNQTRGVTLEPGGPARALPGPECTYCRDVPTSSASEQRKPAPSHLRGAHRPRMPHTGPPRTATANLTTQATERISMSLPNVRR